MYRLISKLSVVSPALRTPTKLSFKPTQWSPAARMATSLRPPQEPGQIKEAVASSSGKARCGRDGCRSAGTCPPKKPGGNFIEDKCDKFDVPHHFHSKPYRLLSYCLMAAIIGYAIVVLGGHKEMEPVFTPYEYMYRRTKSFYFGDGKKSFFHGPNNLIPEEEMEKFTSLPNREEEDLKRRKELRDTHAQEELERRRMRREREARAS